MVWIPSPEQAATRAHAFEASPRFDDLRVRSLFTNFTMSLDEDSLSLLYAQYPCRELQIRALLTLLEVRGFILISCRYH
jgi:hypothetical protein